MEHALRKHITPGLTLGEGGLQVLNEFMPPGIDDVDVIYVVVLEDQGSLEERNVEPLPATRALPMVQSRRYAPCEQQASGVVDDWFRRRRGATFKYVDRKACGRKSCERAETLIDT